MLIDRFARIVTLRFRSLFRRDVVERELDDELQYHVEQQIAKNVRHGMPSDDARYAASARHGRHRAPEGADARHAWHEVARRVGRRPTVRDSRHPPRARLQLHDRAHADARASAPTPRCSRCCAARCSSPCPTGTASSWCISANPPAQVAERALLRSRDRRLPRGVDHPVRHRRVLVDHSSRSLATTDCPSTRRPASSPATTSR